METRKVIYKIAYVLVGLSVAVLIGFGIYQHLLIKKISANAGTKTSMEKATGKTTETGAVKISPPAGKEQERTADEVKELSYQLSAAEEELDMAQQDLSTEAQKQAEFAKNAMALQKKLLQDPTSRKMIQTQIKATLDIMYGPLFAKLDLTAEKLDEFKAMLADQQMATVDMSMDMLDASQSEEKQKEIRRRLENQKIKSDEKLKALLGEDNFETYRTYQDRLPERTIVSGFTDSLGPDEKLTADQEEIIIDTMRGARKNVAAEMGVDPDKMQTSLSEEALAKQLEISNRTNAQYLESVSGILSTSQIQQLENYLNERQKTVEMQLKIASQMFRSRPAAQQSTENREVSMD